GYLVVDRKARDIVFVGSGPEAPAAAAATSEALRYWGGRLAGADLTPPVDGFHPGPKPAPNADAVVVFGSPSEVRGMVGSVETGTGPHPRVAGGESLLVPVSGFEQPPPG